MLRWILQVPVQVILHMIYDTDPCIIFFSISRLRLRGQFTISILHNGLIMVFQIK